jgi:hypothetical protein
MHLQIEAQFLSPATSAATVGCYEFGNVSAVSGVIPAGAASLSLPPTVDPASAAPSPAATAVQELAASMVPPQETSSQLYTLSPAPAVVPADALFPSTGSGLAPGSALVSTAVPSYVTRLSTSFVPWTQISHNVTEIVITFIKGRQEARAHEENNRRRLEEAELIRISRFPEAEQIKWLNEDRANSNEEKRRIRQELDENRRSNYNRNWVGSFVILCIVYSVWNSRKAAIAGETFENILLAGRDATETLQIGTKTARNAAENTAQLADAAIEEIREIGRDGIGIFTGTRTLLKGWFSGKRKEDAKALAER